MKLASLLLALVVIAASCGGSDKKAVAEKENYEKAKETLLQTESKDPTRFIQVSVRDRRNFIGQTVIRGTVVSKAKEAIFKDVELELSFFSKTGALLEKDSETVFEVIQPGSQSEFKTKYFAPKGTDSVSVRVVSAKVENK